MDHCMETMKRWVWFQKSCSENFNHNLKPKQHYLLDKVYKLQISDFKCFSELKGSVINIRTESGIFLLDVENCSVVAGHDGFACSLQCCNISFFLCSLQSLALSTISVVFALAVTKCCWSGNAASIF